jgi:peptide deformylase
MSLLSIRLYPDPVLRVRCPEVETFDADLERLVESMVETMYAAPGVGLAAPQVGVETRLAVVDATVGEEPDTLLILINPKILSTQGSEIDVEGCLSIPDITDKVERPAAVVVSAFDAQGREQLIEAEGLEARAIQHEIDHLDGILTPPPPTARRSARPRGRLGRRRDEMMELAS